MPKPSYSTSSLVPNVVWEAAETKEMESVIGLYGKVFHLWQTDRGDEVPLGMPELMTSFTEEGQMLGGFEKIVGERDKRLGGDWKEKKEKRAYIESPEIHGDADQAWK